MYVTGLNYVQVKIFEPRLILYFALSPSPYFHEPGLGDKENWESTWVKKF